MTSAHTFGTTVHHTSLYWWRGLVLAQSIRHSVETTVFVRINSVQQLCVVHMVCTQQLLVTTFIYLAAALVMLQW